MGIAKEPRQISLKLLPSPRPSPPLPPLASTTHGEKLAGLGAPMAGEMCLVPQCGWAGLATSTGLVLGVVAMAAQRYPRNWLLHFSQVL